MKRIIVELEVNDLDNLTDESAIEVLQRIFDDIEDEDIEIVRLMKPYELK